LNSVSRLAVLLRKKPPTKKARMTLAVRKTARNT
jgi:hypothetical protein